jgi:hypothetical protein
MCPQMFLSKFNSLYPLPQKQATLAQYSAAFRPVVQHDLNTVWVAIQTATRRVTQLGGLPGPAEALTPTNVGSILTCVDCPNCSKNRPTSFALLPGVELASSGMWSKLDFNQWKRLSIMWPKPSFWLDLTTHNGPTGPKS